MSGSPLLDVRGHLHRLRPVPGAVRRLAPGQRRRVRVPARPQRRRQDHDHAQHHGPHAAAAGAASSGRAGTSPAGRPTDVAQAGIGFVPEDRRIFADLTVWENLDVATRGAGAAAASRSSASSTSSPSCASCAAGRAASSPAASSRCSPSRRTLMGNPELLLLDEPSEGLAPLVVEHLQEQIARLKCGGPHHPARRAERGVLARPRRPRLRARKGAYPLRGDGARLPRGRVDPPPVPGTLIG